MRNTSNIHNTLRSLGTTKPDSAWKESTKQRLMAQLDLNREAAAPVSLANFVSISIKETLGRLAWQPIGGVLILLGLIIGPGMVTVNAAKGSLPGDALYPVKRSLERARITFAISNTKKAQLEVDLVSNRLHELQRITKEQAPGAQRRQNIALVLVELKKDTATVKTRLDSIKNEPTSTNKEAVELAKIIDQKTTEYQQTLQSAVEDLDEEAVQTTGGNIGQALATVQDVAINALDILVTQGPDSEKPLTQEELKTRVQQQLDSLKKSVDSFRGQLVQQPKADEPTEPTAGEETDSEKVEKKEEVKADVIIEEKASVPPESEIPEKQSQTEEAPPVAGEGEARSEETVVTEPEKPLPTIADLTKQLEETLVPLITQAEELLKLQDFSSALDTLNKANQQLDDLSKQLQQIQEYVKEEVPVEPAPAEIPDANAQVPATEDPAAEPETENKTDDETEQSEDGTETIDEGSTEQPSSTEDKATQP